MSSQQSSPKPRAARVRVRVRAALAFGLLGILMFGALGRVYAVSVGQNEKYSAKAEANSTRTISLPHERGRIMSSDGQILAQTIFSGTSIYINARQIAAAERASVAMLLGRALDLDPEKLRQKLERHQRNAGLPIAIEPTDAQAHAVKQLMDEGMVPGLHFRSRPKRVYPKGSAGAPVLGFCSLDGETDGSMGGAEGIEAAYDKYLKGQDGLQIRRVDARGRLVPTGDEDDLDPVNGADVFVTLDATIQEFAEQAIAELVNEWDPVFACAVVMEATTGRVLAMVNAPGFDPNDYSRSKAEHRTNHALSAAWEPGSIFKPLIYAGALEDGLIERDTPIPYKPEMFVGRSRKISDGTHPVREKDQVGPDGGPGKGYVTPAVALAKSSNPVAVFVAESVFAGRLYPEMRYLVDYVLPYEGAGRLDARLRGFGFGEYSGIDIGGRRGGESRGTLPSAKQWSRVAGAVINEVPSLAQGYQVQVTALQMLACFNAIAIDGARMRPYVVERVVDPSGTTVFEQEPLIAGNSGFSPDTARAMREILERVVSNDGTAGKAFLKDYRMAGKTGTATISSGGSYGEDSKRNTCSFVGFAPVEAPRLSIIVMAREPRKIHYDTRGKEINFFGGAVAAPYMADIMQRSLSYLGVPKSVRPEEPPKSK